MAKHKSQAKVADSKCGFNNVFINFFSISVIFLQEITNLLVYKNVKS